jgi:uncharacterized radical SAM protein YgiQ
MYHLEGKSLRKCSVCKQPSCLFPVVCRNLQTSHAPLLALYRHVRSVPGVKKITIGSGIRYDLLLDKNGKPADDSSFEYLQELIVHHVSGRLKVAPEHSSGSVLAHVRKPSFELFLQLLRRFTEVCDAERLRLQIVPYFISSLPASGLEEMAELSEELRKLKLSVEQVQDFTPTPMTLASVMYYTGLDPYTMKEIPVPRTPEEKTIQQLFFFLYKKEKRDELRIRLSALKRFDLIKRLGLQR